MVEQMVAAARLCPVCDRVPLLGVLSPRLPRGSGRLLLSQGMHGMRAWTLSTAIQSMEQRLKGGNEFSCPQIFVCEELTFPNVCRGPAVRGWGNKEPAPSPWGSSDLPGPWGLLVAGQQGCARAAPQLWEPLINVSWALPLLFPRDTETPGFRCPSPAC